MDQITCSYTESLSSSSYEHQQQPQNTTESTKPSYHDSLHSVRKRLHLHKPSPKHFIAPLPPTPLKIYQVEPSSFKEVVRTLTSTPEFQYPTRRRLKDKAPPPLVVSKHPVLCEPTPPPPSPPLEGGGTMSPLSAFIMSPDFFEDWGPEGFSLSPKPVGHDPSGGGVMSPLGFSLSPTSFSWCSSVLFSPGTLSDMQL